MKANLIANLLWKYEHLLKEITHQKANYLTEAEYLKAWLKYAQRVNYLHAAQFRTLQPAQIAGTNINEDEAKDSDFINSLPDSKIFF